MEQTNEKNRRTLPGIEEVNTLFDSELAEYEWMQEKEAREKAKEKRE